MFAGCLRPMRTRTYTVPGLTGTTAGITEVTDMDPGTTGADIADAGTTVGTVGIGSTQNARSSNCLDWRTNDTTSKRTTGGQRESSQLQQSGLFSVDPHPATTCARSKASAVSFAAPCVLSRYSLYWMYPTQINICAIHLQTCVLCTYRIR